MVYLLDSVAISDVISMPSQITLSLALPLCISLITPFVLSYLNNKHQLKMKRIELLYEKKQNAYLEFSEAFYSVTQENSSEQFRHLESTANKCRILCPNEEFASALDNLLKFAAHNISESTCESFFYKCIHFLNEDLKSEEKLFR